VPLMLLALSCCHARWIVERTFAWLNRNRRVAKDFEESIASARAWVYIASIQLPLQAISLTFAQCFYDPIQLYRFTFRHLVTQENVGRNLNPSWRRNTDIALNRFG
jgi:hypothetical protein